MSVDRRQIEPELDPDAARIRQRLRALRSRYPGVVLDTALTHIHDDQVVVRAALTLPDGSSVSAYAAEPTDSTGLLDVAIELAEQRATTRALDLLSVGDVTSGGTRSEPRPEPRTRPEPAEEPPGSEVNLPPVVDALRKASLRRTATPTRPTPDLEDVAGDDPIETESEIAAVENAPEPAPVAAAPETDSSDDLDMADYTWTHFWTWARANDLSTKGQVEQRIGRPIDSLTPREVRQLLHDTGIPRT